MTATAAPTVEEILSDLELALGTKLHNFPKNRVG